MTTTNHTEVLAATATGRYNYAVILPLLGCRMENANDDLELVRAICGGSGDALVHLVYDRCGRTLRALASQFGYDGELMQDVCVRLLGTGDWSRLQSWDRTGSLDGWIRTIAYHLCIDQKREQVKYHRRFECCFTEELPSREDGVAVRTLLAGETRVHILEAVNELPERDRTIVLQHCLGHWTITQLAGALGLSVQGARVAKTRALSRLRDLLLAKGCTDV